MNMNSFTAPPVNNALQPDIYNKLDAEIIERTRVANNQLAMRLLLEEKIITKYRNEAQRIISLEKSRVAQDLDRISQTLPAMARIRNFDDQFFPKGPVSSPGARNKRKTKNYLAEKNDDVICHRCYIHHMPLKNKFYNKVSPPSTPTVFDSNIDKDKDVVAADHVAASEPQPGSGSARQKSSKSRLDSDFNDSYRFLDKNLYGRNQDLNDTLTPRLMPNELWKKVVKNVCSQCLKREKTLAARLDRAGYSQERERTVGFDRSLSRGNKSRVDSRAPTRSSSYLSRSNSQRQLKSRGELQTLSRLSSVLGKITEPSKEEDGTKKFVSRDLNKTERSDTAISVRESRKFLPEK
ncbi:hypothetical protein Btru_012136 [Bulinus truncatus]|nr:hypothetical protein Btru_012136 [Bulinus truncatus]